jgi:outer membrane lipoprotein-sorting protein
MIILKTSLLLLIGWAMAPAATAAESADEIMQHVRQATGISRDKIPPAGLELKGQGTFAGLPSHVQLLFDKEGRFIKRVSARLNTTMVFDGRDVWMTDIGGETRIQELADRRKTLFVGLLATSQWIDSASGMKFTVNDQATKEGAIALNFTHEPTQMTGVVHIDGKSWMPVECSLVADGRRVSYKWSEQVEYAGMKLPRKTDAYSGNDLIEAVTIETVSPAPKFIRNPYQAILREPGDATFDSSLPAELEVKKAPTGHLLVRAKVNGKDVGWFILDSGAGSNILSTKVAKELALEQFGTLPALGVAGTAKSTFARPETLVLGRLSIKNPLVVCFDLSFLDGPMAVPIAGIIGYGTFYRSVIEMDLQAPAVSLFDPKSYDQERVDGHWQRLYQTSRVSCVEAEFEGHRGIFRLDTGAPGAVVIHAPAVERFKLLDDRPVQDALTGGVGGMLKTKKGTLKYFELGGTRTENVPALFATQRLGAFDSTETLGNIGHDLVKSFKIVFDYQHQRIAFLKREPATEGK